MRDAFAELIGLLEHPQRLLMWAFFIILANLALAALVTTVGTLNYHTPHLLCMLQGHACENLFEFKQRLDNEELQTPLRLRLYAAPALDNLAAFPSNEVDLLVESQDPEEVRPFLPVHTDAFTPIIRTDNARHFSMQLAVQGEVTYADVVAYPDSRVAWVYLPFGGVTDPATMKRGFGSTRLFSTSLYEALASRGLVDQGLLECRK